MPASRPLARTTAAATARARPASPVRARDDGRFATRGHPVGLAAVERMIRDGAPQALLFVGPGSVGKTTLALDLAAGLLCHAADAATRPCRTCRSCRLVDHRGHQDLHRLAPGGPGRQVRLGEPVDPEPGTVRHLIRELARLPVEGSRRVAIVEQADRLNEDAQHALLKTLEEPPAGATIVLCADEPERLLPTVHSRTAILRLGPVAVRAMEQLLAEHGVEPPHAGRLARLADGRPGRALALAAAPDALAAREELARSLLDLIGATTGPRLVAVRQLLARAADLAQADEPTVDQPPQAGATTGHERAGTGGVSDGASSPTTGAAPPARGSSAERRRAARSLLSVWTALARDLLVVAAGDRGAVSDMALLEELETAASAVSTASLVAFLGRLVRGAELLEANANPELLADTLIVAWPYSGEVASIHKPRPPLPVGSSR
jgi:DNA polymerase-3 subunit delta'